jgi:hypothetical protein
VLWLNKEEIPMKAFAPIIGLLLLSATAVTPAEANWFSSQKHNTMYNIGSVRNPTPQELRFFYAQAAFQQQAKTVKK